MEINLDHFSKRTLSVFQETLKFVAHMGHGFIGSEHLLWALAKDRAPPDRHSEGTDWIRI